MSDHENDPWYRNEYQAEATPARRHSFPPIIGISGYAQSGKDTVAKILHDLYGYERVSFADQLREFIYNQDLWMPQWSVRNFWIMGIECPPEEDRRWYGTRVNEVIDTFGWDVAKVRFPYIRTLQIKTGTEAGRKMKDTLWVDAAIEKAPKGKLLVFPDTRFNNERAAVESRGGVVWRVDRPGVGPVSNHPSELEQDGWAVTHIINNEDIKSLADTVLHLMGSLA